MYFKFLTLSEKFYDPSTPEPLHILLHILQDKTDNLDLYAFAKKIHINQ